MSVEKVNRYKENKKNRKEIIAKEKRQKRIGSMVGWAITILLIVGIATGIGFTAKNAYTKYQASLPDYNRSYFAVSDMTGIQTALESANAPETAAPEAESETAAAE